MAVIIPKMADYRSHDMLLRRSLHTGILFWARRVAAVLIFLLAVGAAVGASLLTPYFLAALTANILLLTISAVASFALFTGVGTKLALFCLGTGRRLTATLSGLLTLIFLGWLYVLVLRPSASHFAEVVPYANTKYWELPTGSVIAYSEYDPPLGVAVKPDAIVYLHGGPGVRQAPFDQDLYGSWQQTDSVSFSMIRREAVFRIFCHICGITQSPVSSPIWKRSGKRLVSKR